MLKIDLNNVDLSEFTEIFLSILGKHAPKKQKFIQPYNSNFLTKNLRKVIMKRSKLRKKYLRVKPNKAKSLYNKQRNFCLSILRKNKRDLNNKNLNNKIVTDNRKFWKTISPPFSEKAFHRQCITLKESNKTVTNNEELAETFNTFFSKIIPNLNLYNNLGYENHSSILKIREMMCKKNYHFPLNLLIERKYSMNYKN